jgi:hypothetical protein
VIVNHLVKYRTTASRVKWPHAAFMFH